MRRRLVYENLLSERQKLESQGVYFPCPKTMPPSAKVNFRFYPTHAIGMNTRDDTRLRTKTNCSFRKPYVIGLRVEHTKNNSKIGIKQNIELYTIFMSFMDGIIVLSPQL